MKIFAIIFLCFTLIFANCKNVNEDCINKISKTDFDSLVELYNISANNLNIDTTVAIDLARVYNTISFGNMTGTLYENFITSYTNIFYYNVIKELEATRSKGGSFYSKKFDIHIGGLPFENSYYCIIH